MMEGRTQNLEVTPAHHVYCDLQLKLYHFCMTSLNRNVWTDKPTRVKLYSSYIGAYKANT
ncbi:hypothetical protein DPMN_040066 [Dreissena polymorpha]|uniref:Uncharacterized protein n=1 Tax=Dreissena polymorpha TaxID=45954 RepID=A0A9D4CVZ3_DREPO|nr:hypothetical protein DPMN_040066 [Dreissena polymorpha]